MSFSLDQLQKLAMDFVSTRYGIEQMVSIEISSRMKSKLGAFVTREGEAYKIQLSKNLIDYYNDATIVDVLYHECVHYALFTLKLPYRDGNEHFEKELKRLNVSSSRTYPYKGIVHHYECPNCRIPFKKKIKGYEKRYNCGRCRGKFKYFGEGIV